jgi:hypothetical protein
MQFVSERGDKLGAEEAVFRIVPKTKIVKLKPNNFVTFCVFGYKFETREGTRARCGSGVKSSPGLMN